MPQSLARNLIHLVFSTKNRVPLLHPTIRPQVHAYLAGICQTWKSPAFIIGGVDDHVHVLFNLSKNYALARVVEEIKVGSSKWIKTLGPAYRRFHWQNGYGAFSVSPSLADRVEAYIAGQEKHHRRQSFQDEFRALCRKHGVEFDER